MFGPIASLDSTPHPLGLVKLYEPPHLLQVLKVGGPSGPVTDKFRWPGSNSLNLIINYYFANEIAWVKPSSLPMAWVGEAPFQGTMIFPDI